jgi:predicted nucleotidyltransferase
MISTSPSDASLLAAFRRRVDEVIARGLEEEQRAAELLRNSVLAAIRPAIEAARAEGLCGKVWLFGSFAWGSPGERSDVDLLVEGDDAEVGWRVSRVCPREVHVLRTKDAPASLLSRVLADGVPL